MRRQAHFRTARMPDRCVGCGMSMLDADTNEHTFYTIVDDPHVIAKSFIDSSRSCSHEYYKLTGTVMIS